MKETKPSYYYWRIIYAIAIPVLVLLFILERFDNSEVGVVIIILFFILVIPIVFLVRYINSQEKKKGFKTWAEINNLNYEKKIKISFLSLNGSTNISDIIWGKKGSQKIFIYNAINKSSNLVYRHVYCGIDEDKVPKIFPRYLTVVNGEFYDQLNSSGIESIIEGSSKVEPYDLKFFLNVTYLIPKKQ